MSRAVLHLPMSDMPEVIAESIRSVLAQKGLYVRHAEIGRTPISYDDLAALLREIGNNATSALQSLDENAENIVDKSIESPWHAHGVAL